MAKRWTNEEISEFVSMYKTHDYPSMSRAMGRTQLSLKNKARRLGIASKVGGRPIGSTESICRKGLHEMTPENVYLRIRSKNGRLERQCKACMDKANGVA